MDKAVRKTTLNSGSYFYLANVNDFSDSYTGILQPSEIISYERYRRKQDKDLFLCGRYILRNELAKNNIPFKAKIGFNPYKKPEISDYPGFNFNISHSYPWVVVTFSKSNKIGVDIEKIVNYNREDLIKYAEIVFHKSEIEIMKKMDLTGAQHFFTKLWVLKESYIKMDGRGFLLDTKNILFEKHKSNNLCLINNSLKKVQIRLLNPVPDFYLAIMENKIL